MLIDKLNEKLTAQNIFLDENTGGKGRYFKARILQPGLVKYSFGVCLLEKETIDKFVNDFVGCPVIIGHNDVTTKNADKLSCGNICHVWYDNYDGWYWVDGIIDNQEALNKIAEGYKVSCQYEITEYSNNTKNELHNGNPYDKVILNGKPEHLAIVETPRYENAMIAVNAIDKTETEAESPPPADLIRFIKKAINEIKDTDMFNKLFKKEELNMNKEELRKLFADCLQKVLIAKNEEDEKEKELEEEEAKKKAAEEEAKKKAANKCKNEDVDKRKLIDEVAGILKDAGCDDEVIRTAIAKMEKLGYDKSEAGTADNGKKAKCEEEAKNKAKNSIDALKGLFASVGVQKPASTYVTQSDAIELGNQLF